MTHISQAQSLAGIATILALPLIYIGGTVGIPPLTIAGLMVFAAAMLTTPALRFVVRWRAQAQPSTAAPRHAPARSRFWKRRMRR